jgi:hypothetical protein
MGTKLRRRRRRNPVKVSDVEMLGFIALGGFGLYIVWNIYQDIKNSPSIGSTLGKELCDFGQSSGLNQAMAPLNNLLTGQSC